jgi:hypothetical protein
MTKTGNTGINVKKHEENYGKKEENYIRKKRKKAICEYGAKKNDGK